MSFNVLSNNASEVVAPLMSDHRALPREYTKTQQSQYFRWKAAIDRPLSAILMVIFAPLIALLWLIVKCTSPGPGFYQQERVGQGGRTFKMIKLRSMRQDAEKATGAIWCSKNDPRVTWFGLLLRKFHLDELPQLLNVLKGEMSLVGPRPERPEFVEVLAKKIPAYRNRLAVPPGITGLAQLNLPPDTDLDSVRRKLVLDLEYVEQADAWMEARLLICTATRLIKVPTIGLFGLTRDPRVEPAKPQPALAEAELADAAALGTQLQPSLQGAANGSSRKPMHEHNARPQRPARIKPR